MNLPTEAGVSTVDTTIELLGNSLKARIYRPASDASPKPAVLFFHQGGLVIMDHLTDNHFARFWRRDEGCRFLSITGCARRMHFRHPLKMPRRFGNTFRLLVTTMASTLHGLRWQATVRAA